MVPPPKSHQRYHFGPGKYTSLKGRPAPAPATAPSPARRGTGSPSFGRSCVQTMSLFCFASSSLCQPQARDTHTCALLHRPDRAALDQFDHAAIIAAGVDLRAHLRGDARLLGRLLMMRASRRLWVSGFSQ